MTSPLDPFTAATVYEALHEISDAPCALTPLIKPLFDTWAICGPARTVITGPGHNLWIHRAVYAADPGDVLVVSVQGGFDFGYWGEILSTAAQERGLAGLVIDGCVRDRTDLGSIGFPVFAPGLCVIGTGKDPSGGAVGVPITIGNVAISTGDMIVGDVDGVVSVPAGLVEETAKRAAARFAKETEIVRQLRGGATTLDLYGWSS